METASPALKGDQQLASPSVIEIYISQACIYLYIIGTHYIYIYIPDTGIEPRSAALQADSLLDELPGKPHTHTHTHTHTTHTHTTHTHTHTHWLPGNSLYLHYLRNRYFCVTYSSAQVVLLPFLVGWMDSKLPEGKCCVSVRLCLPST